MSVTLRQLRAFISVAKLGSFTEAANSFHVTQSALSSLLKELEAELGVRLLDRGTRTVSLSDIGKEFFPIASKMLEDLDSAVSEIGKLREMHRGVVRVAAPQLMSCTLIPSAIHVFREQFPQVEVRLIDCPNESALIRVLSGEVDFCVGPERVVTPGIDAFPLFKSPMALVCSREHSLARKKKIAWRDVLSFPFIALSGEAVASLSLELLAYSNDLRLESVHEVSYITTSLSMVAAGLGITAAPAYVASLAQFYELELRPLHAPVFERQFSIFCKKGRALSPAAEKLLNTVIHAVGNSATPAGDVMR